MASHYHPHHCHHQTPPPPSISTHCCCNSNPSYTCCSPPPPPDQLVQAIGSLLSQSHPIPTHLYTQNQCQNYHRTHPLHQHQYRQEQQIHSAIASLLCRIEALESSLKHHSHRSSCSLRDAAAAARIIQTHFRAFLVRRSRTLRHLKHLGYIKTSFSALKSSFSNEKTLLNFPALSHNAVDLLLQLDSIEDGDPMIRDGKRSISRDLVQFLDAIERVAVKKHLRYVKAAQNMRFGEKVNKSRTLNSKHVNSGDDDKRKLLQNLRGRVEKISRLCKVSANDDQDSEPEGIHHVVDDDDGGPNGVSISRRNGFFVQKQEVQPRVKKSVSFAENGNISKVYNSTYEPVLSGDVTCLDGSSSSDDQGEVLGNVSIEVEDVMDSSQGAEGDEEALVDDGGSPHSSDGERNSRRDVGNDGRNIVKGHKEKLLFSAPLPLKMENRAGLMKSKGVRIVT